MNNKSKADLALTLVTVGWGASFILSKQVLGEMAVFNFLGVRFLIAFAVTFVIFIKQMRRLERGTLIRGVALGVALFLAFSIQTIGLNYTTVSKSAFITGLNVVMVPLMITAYRRKLPAVQALLGAVMAVIGLGLLTMTGTQLEIGFGDLLTLISAVFFALHIVGVSIASDYRAKALSGRKRPEDQADSGEAIPLAVLQIGTVGALSLLMSFITEQPTLPQSAMAWFNIVLLAVVCTAGAYVVQNVAQQYTTATRTALIYAMEPVFAAVFGFILLKELLSPVAMVGAALIVGGTLVSELQFGWLKKKQSAKGSTEAEA